MKQIFVGSKPVMSYVSALVSTLADHNSVSLFARGRAISRAVDVVEIVRHRFDLEAKIKSIETWTETVAVKNRKNVNISCMEIKITKF